MARALEELRSFFSNEGFMPHIHCYLDRGNLVWTMVVTDSLIALAYVVISVTLYSLVRRTKLPFRLVFLAFGLFILACGTTHMMEVYNLWVPNYWLSAWIKAITAIASVATAIYLVKLYPKIIDLASTARELSRTKLKLEEALLKNLATPPELKRLLMRVVVVPLALSVGLVGICLFQANYLRSIERALDRSDEIIRWGHQLETIAKDVQVKTRGYWFGGPKEILISAEKSLRNFDETFKKLKILVSSNPERLAKLENINTQFQVWRKFAEKNLKISGTVAQRRKTFGKFYQENEDLIEKTAQANDRFLRVERQGRAEQAGTTKYLSLVFSVMIGFVVLAFGLIFAGLGRNALRQVSRNFAMSLEMANRTQQELQKAVATRDEFLSIASHELKTPLTSLKLQLEMSERWLRFEMPGQVNQSKTMPNEKFAKTIAISNSQVTRIQNLVDDLLDVSRINAGKLQFHYEQLDLTKLVTEVVNRLKEGILAKASRVELKALEPVFAFCDGFRMEQVVINLLTNAVKYGAGKPITISVDSVDERARIWVHDEGPGIPKDLQSRIFERYVRANGAKNIAGLGLGLYISKEIIRGHRGAIRVESEPGQGATFVAEIPRYSA